MTQHEEPKLPLATGYYESAEFPVSEGCMAYRLNADGVWTMEGEEWKPRHVQTAMPLTRLVPETELADRIDVENFAELLSGFMSRETSIADLMSAAEYVLLEIKQGRMWKLAG